ncbi:MAG: NAD(P)H-dependent oxidoreductase [Erythrobacter sp.]|uniref:flavodoxin family protein n=1 Tax=Erythrobacter sp. TaxID=1042 RepID=UPI0032980C7D
MGEDRTLLIIWHSRTGASEQMAKAAARHENARLIRASNVTTHDLLDAAGYVFVCPENLASISGEMKEMFDTHYYAVLGKTEGRPYASIIAAGSDGEGAQRQLDRIATGWRLKRVADPKVVNFGAQKAEEIWAEKTVPPQIERECEELGLSISEGISLGVF